MSCCGESSEKLLSLPVVLMTVQVLPSVMTAAMTSRSASLLLSPLIIQERANVLAKLGSHHGRPAKETTKRILTRNFRVIVVTSALLALSIKDSALRRKTQGMSFPHTCQQRKIVAPFLISKLLIITAEALLRCL